MSYVNILDAPARHSGRCLCDLYQEGMIGLVPASIKPNDWRLIVGKAKNSAVSIQCIERFYWHIQLHLPKSTSPTGGVSPIQYSGAYSRTMSCVRVLAINFMGPQIGLCTSGTPVERRNGVADRAAGRDAPRCKNIADPSISR